MVKRHGTVAVAAHRYRASGKLRTVFPDKILTGSIHGEYGSIVGGKLYLYPAIVCRRVGLLRHSAKQQHRRH